MVVNKIKQKSDYQFSDGELECEEVIMNEKERFGRVRTSMMRNLRKKHGNSVANRTLSRINKRLSEGSLRIKYHLQTIDYQK
jgi:hypothetical protein